MSDPSAPETSNWLCTEIRDVLTRLYDSAYLVSHPLLYRIPGCLERDAMTAAQNLRRLLLEALEHLRPPTHTPPDDPSWRPYLVLHHRYVLGKDPLDVEQELSLSRRQRQREQQRGIEALAIALSSRYGALDEPQPSPTDDTLWHELARPATEQETFDATGELGRALAAVQPLANARGVTLRTLWVGELPMWGSPSLFGQLVVLTLSHVIRSRDVTLVALQITPGHAGVELEIVAQPCEAETGSLRTELPETLLALAHVQNATISEQFAGEKWRLTISLPRLAKERVVAILEDNQDVEALFARYLAGHGYRLARLLEGSNLSQQVAQMEPDAIILDVILSRKGGWEILQNLKADPRLADIPVIVCSVVNDPELAASLGADAYLHKPVRQAQLLECLARVLGH